MATLFIETDSLPLARLSLFSKAAGGHSAISLMQSVSVKHAALITQVSSPSLHELMSTDIRSFHVHFSSSRLEHSVC